MITRIDSPSNIEFIRVPVQRLAVLGGQPAFSRPLHVGCPNVVGEDTMLARIKEIFAARWLTNGGSYLSQFESMIAEKTNCRFCIATCNATTALQIATRAMGMNQEVIVPSMTFVATPHALSWQGVRPIFADINPTDWTICLESVERSLTNQTTGIIGVHLWGQPCQIDELKAFANAHRLKLLFDSSHALGCSYRNEMIGSFGDAEVFSFHATKFVNSAEGGAVVTNDAKLAKRLRDIRNFGFDASGTVQCVGTNAKMSEVAAAIGVTSMEHIEEIVGINQRNFNVYKDHFSDLPGITVRDFNPGQKRNYQYVVAEIDETLAGLSRDEFITVLHAENVLAKRYFSPGCHRLPPYQSENVRLPITESIVERVITLPTGLAIHENDIFKIGQIFRAAMQCSERVRRMCQQSHFTTA